MGGHSRRLGKLRAAGYIGPGNRAPRPITERAVKLKYRWASVFMTNNRKLPKMSRYMKVVAAIYLLGFWCPMQQKAAKILRAWESDLDEPYSSRALLDMVRGMSASKAFTTYNEIPTVRKLLRSRYWDEFDMCIVEWSMELL